MTTTLATAAMPPDQAHGLRRLFAARAPRPAPSALPMALVHNPHAGFGGVVMEALCAAFGEAGRPTLVVDAADSASAPAEIAGVDLRAAVEPLAGGVSYLAARGLPMRWLDARATTAGFVDALLDAAPPGAAVVVHASAADLRRMFSGRLPRPLLVVSARPAALTDAYAAVKRLTERLGPMTFDAIVVGELAPRAAARVAARLAECADRFLGAALGAWASLDPFAPPGACGDGGDGERNGDGDGFAAIADAQLAHALAQAAMAARRGAPPAHLGALGLPTLTAVPGAVQAAGPRLRLPTSAHAARAGAAAPAARPMPGA